MAAKRWTSDDRRRRGSQGAGGANAPRWARAAAAGSGSCVAVSRSLFELVQGDRAARDPAADNENGRRALTLTTNEHPADRLVRGIPNPSGGSWTSSTPRENPATCGASKFSPQPLSRPHPKLITAGRSEMTGSPSCDNTSTADRSRRGRPRPQRRRGRATSCPCLQLLARGQAPRTCACRAPRVARVSGVDR